MQSGRGLGGLGRGAPAGSQPRPLSGFRLLGYVFPEPQSLVDWEEGAGRKGVETAGQLGVRHVLGFDAGPRVLLA